MDLAYLEIGEGRPLMLLHGFLASGRQWLDHGPARALATHGYRVILPDLRGHGDGARPHDPAAYPPDVLTDDGFALIAHLGLDDFDLGGYSLGAKIVAQLMARGAEPRRAVIAGQGLAAMTNTAPRGRYRRARTALVNGDTIEPSSPDAETASWIGRLGGDPVALLAVLDSLVSTPPDALRKICEADVCRRGRRRSDTRLARWCPRIGAATCAVPPGARRSLDGVDRGRLRDCHGELSDAHSGHPLPVRRTQRADRIHSGWRRTPRQRRELTSVLLGTLFA
jgi:pimeloyl-ACP methyl ester carboxylesterase